MSKTAVSDSLLTYKEAAAILAMTARTVKTLIKSGQIKPFLMPDRKRSRWVKASEIARFIGQG
jgi:excisionase family DNA binding protein